MTDRIERSHEQLVQLSKWVNEANAERDPEALTWQRIAKLAEESGEVAAAFLGVIGGNPRKGVTNGIEKVIEEALDVAVAAVGLVEHLNGHQGTALFLLDEKIIKVHKRAGLCSLDENTPTD